MRSMQNLEDAIKYARGALDKIPSDYLTLATMLSNLGNLTER